MTDQVQPTAGLPLCPCGHTSDQHDPWPDCAVVGCTCVQFGDVPTAVAPAEPDNCTSVQAPTEAEVLANAEARRGISSETMAAVLASPVVQQLDPEAGVLLPSFAAEAEAAGFAPLPELPDSAYPADAEPIPTIPTDAVQILENPPVAVPVKITRAPAVDGPLKRVSNSELKCFRRCRRKWWLTYVRRLRFNRPDVAGARALGTRLHESVAEGYVIGERGFNVALAYAQLERALVRDRAKIDAYYEAHPEVPKAAREDQHKALNKDAELAQIMVEGYAEWLTETAADADLEVLAIEEEVEVRLMEFMGITVHLMGKLDKRFRRISSGFLGFLDFKSVDNLTNLPKTANMDEQGKTYSVLLKLAHGEHVDGETIRMLRKVKRTKTAKPPFFGDHEVRWNKHQLNAYVRRLYGMVAELLGCELRLLNGEDHQVVVFPTPTNDCSWDCDFYPVCDMFDDGSRVDDALAAHYHAADPNDRYKNLLTNAEESTT